MTGDPLPTHVQLAFDWRKVIMVRYWYRNQDNSCTKSHLPHTPTMHGDEVSKTSPYFDPVWGNTGCSEYKIAKIRGLLDTWVPVCHITFQAHHSLTLQGQRARNAWREWNRRLYGKRKK